MKNNFIEREMLSQFVEPLVDQKYPKLPYKYKQEIREETIDKLDERIGLSIFDDMSDLQLMEFDK